jgi:hypothetical protein
LVQRRWTMGILLHHEQESFCMLKCRWEVGICHCAECRMKMALFVVCFLFRVVQVMTKRSSKWWQQLSSVILMFAVRDETWKSWCGVWKSGGDPSLCPAPIGIIAWTKEQVGFRVFVEGQSPRT